MSSSSSRTTTHSLVSTTVVVSVSALAAAVVIHVCWFRKTQQKNEKEEAPNVEAQEVQFPASDGTAALSGTLHLPKSSPDARKRPAALLIHGSGPIDRNGNVVNFVLGRFGGAQWNTFNRLATSLVEQQGMAVLCYDKRGIGQSLASSNPNWHYEAGMHDLVHDVVAAYRFLTQQPDIDASQIVLVGHSEGAILLPLIAETIGNTQELPPPKGLVFLAGFGASLDEAVRYQQHDVLQEVAKEPGLKGWILRRFVTREKLKQQYKDLLKQAGNRNQSFYSTHWGLVKFPSKWFREHLEWDAKKALRECQLPCLAISGGKDVQIRAVYCEPEVAKEMAPRAISLETHVLPNLTHTLRSMDGTPSLLNTRTDYALQAKEPLEPALLTILHQWLNKLLVV